MSTYPEHDKLRAVMEQTQAAGEFTEWLGTQGVVLMTYREDLSDLRPVDRECKVRRDRANPRPCDRKSDDGDHSLMYWMRHCLHWEEPDDDGEYGECCYCSKGHYYEVTGISAWVSPHRGLQDLLADWAGIDQGAIEREKRAMLASLRAAQ